MGRIKDTVNAHRDVREARRDAKHDPDSAYLVDVALDRRAAAAAGHGPQRRNGR